MAQLEEAALLTLERSLRRDTLGCKSETLEARHQWKGSVRQRRKPDPKVKVKVNKDGQANVRA